LIDILPVPLSPSSRCRSRGVSLLWLGLKFSFCLFATMSIFGGQFKEFFNEKDTAVFDPVALFIVQLVIIICFCRLLSFLFSYIKRMFLIIKVFTIEHTLTLPRAPCDCGSGGGYTTRAVGVWYVATFDYCCRLSLTLV
jgi:hypothetical protein